MDRSLGGVAEGTNLLVTGGPTSGKTKFVDEVVSEGIENGEGTVYVSTDDPAEEVLSKYGGVTETTRFYVVDCATEGSSEKRYDNVKFADSPSDMTSIGVKVSALLKEFRDELGIERNRVFVDSISTLLMYSNLETVFRFLHVFTGRIRSIEGVGVFVIDSVRHDEKVYSTMRQLFDGVVEVKSEDEEAIRVRIEGLEDEPTEWVTLSSGD